MNNTTKRSPVRYNESSMSVPECLEEPTRDLLFGEHQILLRSAGVTRLVSRIVLVGMVLLQIFYGSFSLRWNIALMSTGVLAAAAWYLQESILRRNIDRLEELIIEVEAAGDEDVAEDADRVVYVRPVEVKDSNYEMTKSQPPAQQQGKAWIGAYIKWRHERWVYARFETAHTLEPLAWSALLLIIGISQIIVLR